MKQLSTKTIESLMVATAASLRDIGKMAKERHLDRMLQHHDRKGELRAGILGLNPLEFRTLQKRYVFDDLIKQHGFRSRQDFLQALLGRLRHELIQRGWSRHRIDTYIDSKLLFAV